VLTTRIAAEGAIVFAKACEMGCEGIIARRQHLLERPMPELDEGEEPGLSENLECLKRAHRRLGLFPLATKYTKPPTTKQVQSSIAKSVTSTV